ncbi:MAG TPA: FG-GAP-like repeat-containing protein, partial [Bryobacteraceae bacterium]
MGIFSIRVGRWQYIALAAMVLFPLGCARQQPRDESALARHRNLGKALYENPTTKLQAVAEFKQALEIAPDSARDKLNYALALLKVEGREQESLKLLQEVQKQDPSLPHTWFNLGIYYSRRGDTAHAIAQFEGMVKLTPNEPIAHYQLGTLYRQLNRNDAARDQFEIAAKLDPQLAGARFQLFNLYRVAGNAEQAKRYLADFQRLQQLQKTWVIPEDTSWCSYAEIYDPPEVRSAGNAVTISEYTDTPLPGMVDAATAGLTLIDSTGSGQTDLLVWSSRGIELFIRGRQPASKTGLEAVKDVIGIAPGDFDNDGLMDLCVLTAKGPQLFRNTGGKFIPQQANLPQRRFDAAVWIDYDHDYDLDLVLLGSQSALMRNQGALSNPGGWEDRTGDFPFIEGQVISAQKLRVDPDSKAFDLAVFYRDHTPVLYRDQLGGQYKVQEYKEPAPVGIKRVEADFDAAGRMDGVRIDADGSVHYLRNKTGFKNWIRVHLKGIRSLKLGQDALVEVKAGRLYRRALYAGVPLTFDTGDNASVDVLRITWPNGLIQNEVRQTANQTHSIEEAQRLSGSCPMIWC